MDEYRDDIDIVDTIGRRVKVIAVNESGLYNLIFKSRKPEAKRFKRWVTHEVLPTIRKTGGYVAKDVADILGFRDAWNMTRILDDDEKDTHIMSTVGGNQKVTIINEAGLYAAIMKSRRPEAKRFKRWVTHEVLPTIRKTGGYVANDDLFIDMYLPFADEQTKLMFRTTFETVRKQNEQITDILGIGNPTMALKRLDVDELNTIEITDS